MIKSTYIADVVDLLLDGAADADTCRPQIELLSDTIYGCTSGGAFVSFSHNEDIAQYKSRDESGVLDGVKITSADFEFEADATLYFRNGIIHNMEIVCKQGSYPRRDLTKYILTQVWNGAPGRIISKK
ncbi:MAG TPA: hypothetical protein VL442_00010 [Mucilaginibacter sp.]|jgi:hypothetical protein|nr:hypothetical protein [Mucilaginibacter sp.]